MKKKYRIEDWTIIRWRRGSYSAVPSDFVKHMIIADKKGLFKVVGSEHSIGRRGEESALIKFRKRKGLKFKIRGR